MASPAELFDACDAATAGRPAGWCRGRMPVLWLTSPAVTVAGRTWHARHRRHRDGQLEHGYTVRQATQIRAALLPVLASYEGPLTAITRHVC